MDISGEEFGQFATAWDMNEKDAVRQAKEAGIVVNPLPEVAMEELRKRWSVIEPQWIADAKKLGIDGKSAVVFYRTELAKLEGGQ